MLFDQDIVGAVSVKEIREFTKEDPRLQLVCKFVNSAKQIDFAANKLEEFKSVWDTLAIYKGLVLKEDKIVIPSKLENRIIEIAHEGHMGIIKCKQFLRSRVWFPGMDRKIKQKIDQCIPCQAAIDTVKKESVKVSELPSGPWEVLSVDLWGPTPGGDYLLVVMDHYSRFPEVEFVSSTSAKSVIPKLDRILSSMGIPSKILSDNGPPFNSVVFSRYSQYMGFEHHRITPLWPQANGMVENFMRSINKLVRTSVVENSNWKQELFKFLRNYRATPHPSTNSSPSALLFNGRQVRSRLPENSRRYNDDAVREYDRMKKEKMKKNADRNTKDRVINVDDWVLVRQQKKNKYSTPFSPTPYKVIQKKGTMFTVKNPSNGHVITRNISFFKVLSAKDPVLKAIDTDMDDEIGETDINDIQPGEYSADNSNEVHFSNDNYDVEVDNDDDYEVADEYQELHTNENSERRYPHRSRRLPTTLKDYVMT